MTIHRTWHTLININNIWNFNSLFRVCLIFYTYDSANFKSIGNNTMKNATRYCAGPAYYRMCSTDVYCSKQTGSSSTKGNHHPSFLRFWIGQKKNCRCSQNLWRRRNVVKTENLKANIRKWIARFYYFRHLYSAGSACVLLTHQAELPIDMATLSALLINILLGSFQLFLHSDQPLSEGEIILFSGVCQSGSTHYPRRRRWLHALTDRLLWCATDDDQRQHHHAEHHFQL